MVPRALVTFGILVLAVILFSIPLILKYHVFKPQHKHVVVGDTFPVSVRLSSTWCQGIDLQSKSDFSAYVYDSEPSVVETDVKRTISVARISLPHKTLEYWGFHLLKGSTVNISSCARLPVADVTVVKGVEGLEKCLHEHKKNNLKDSAKDDSSESEGDTSSISSSQGVIKNETDSYVCSNALRHEELPSSYRCKYPFDSTVAAQTLWQEMNETDYYYFIFSANTYLDILPNELLAVFTVDRTHYDTKGSVENCTKGNYCRLPYPLNSDRVSVVRMEGINSTLRSEKMLMACRPREWIFMIFYAAFMLVIFIFAFQ